MRFQNVKMAGLAALTMALVACGAAKVHNPNLQVEGKLAVYGRAVMAAGSDAVTVVDRTTAERLRQPGADQAQVKKDAVAAADVLGQLGTYGQQLAAALTVVDTVNDPVDRGQALTNARNVINVMQALVVTGVVNIGDPTMRSEVGRLLGNISKALLTAAMALPDDPKPQAVVWRPAWQA